MLLALNNGTTELILNNEDFTDLLREKLGDDAVAYFQQVVETSTLNYIQANMDFEAYEAQNEEMRSALLEIQESAKAIGTYTDNAKRINRSSITEHSDEIVRIINNTI